jgi:hypothetical protein
MADNASRRGAANLGMPLMIVSFLVIGGFLYWLNLQAAEQAAMQIVEEETAEVPFMLEGATTLVAADIQLDASPFEGQLVILEDVPVQGSLGTQGFWLEMPNGNPFLVALDDAQIAAGTNPTMGQTASVGGTILAVNDSILDAWSNAGTISEGDRLAAEFATHFMQAQVVEASGGSEGGAEGASGS